MTKENITVSVRNVSKHFKLPHERQNSLKGIFISLFRSKRTYEKQQVLDNLSFDIKEGEFFGIVGRNGSGKSTLLKLIAGIYSTNKGDIQVNGKLTPFIELGVGFNPELTGRENVFLNGALLGFSRSEVEKLYSEIVGFAELERFMDQKLKNYSSGMQVRLAFSIAIRAESDILILDEVLAVGDAAFQRKCLDYFSNLKKNNQTVVLVTHDMSVVRKFCDRCILIKDGKIIDAGNPERIASLYDKVNLKSSENSIAKQNKKTKKQHRGSGELRIKHIETYNGVTSTIQNTFSPNETIGVRIIYDVIKDVNTPSVSFIFQNEEDVTVFATNNLIVGEKTTKLKVGQKLTYETTIENIFTDDNYYITAAAESTDFRDMYDILHYAHKFVIGGHPLPHASAHPIHKSTIGYSQEEIKI